MKPFVIEDALSVDTGEFDRVWNELNPKNRSWKLNNYSYKTDPPRPMWGIDEYCPIPLLGAASTIRMKCQKVLRKPLTLVRMHTNGQTSTQTSEFHIDYPDKETFFSAIYFARPDWNAQWGGAFTCYDEEKYHMFPYIPNQAVVIPSEWEHYGEPPSTFTSELRITVAFMYCLTEKLDEMNEKHTLKVIHNLRL